MRFSTKSFIILILAIVITMGLSGTGWGMSIRSVAAEGQSSASMMNIFGDPAIASKLPKDTSGQAGVQKPTSITSAANNDMGNSEISSKKSLIGDLNRDDKEDISKRTRTSRTFIRPDGSKRVDESRYSVNYFSGKAWLPIDTNIKADSSMAGFSYSMLANQFKVRLNHGSGKAAISFSLGDESVTYKPLGMKDSSGTVQGDSITFKNAWTNANLIYQVQEDELKMEIHLLNEKAPKSFSFEMQTKGVTYRVNEDQSIDFLNASDVPVFKIPSFWVQDSSSPDRRYDKLKINIAEGKGKSIIQLNLDTEGLQYPIVIDPSTAAIYDVISSGGSYHLYDNGGRLSQVASSLGTIDYQYDIKGNLIRKSKTNNLFVNGSFELNTGTSGMADGWNPIYLVPQTVSTPVSGGIKSQKLTASGVMNGYYVGMSQRIRVDGGKAFISNASLNIESLSNANVYLYMDFMSSQNYWVGNSSESYSGTTNGKFITLTTTGTVPATATYADVYIMILANANYGSSTLYVDMMNFRYDTEPNLLSNPGFEAYSGLAGMADAWSKTIGGTTPSIQVANQSVNEGFRSHKISDTTIASGGYAGISQNVKMKPNSTYNLTGIFTNTSLTNAKAQLYIDFLNNQHQYIGSNVSESTLLTSNVTLSLSGTTPTNTAYAVVYVLLRSTAANGAGTIYVDLMNLKYSAAPNKLANSGFELSTGNKQIADGWGGFAQQYELITSPVNSGTKAQKIAGSNLSSGTMNYIFQSIKVNAGASYSTSVNVNVQSLSNANIRFQINFFNAQNQIVGVQSFPYSTINNAYTQIYMNNFTVPANAVFANVIVMIEATAANGSGTIYVDDIAFN
ncbi:hypothetical protein [Cohnella sp. GCM10012308]|uniref:hypothetical protein n=1 Tax=Cohnella sp. GCM10012308 TaxID=3317329 RepID=UPI0036179600